MRRRTISCKYRFRIEQIKKFFREKFLILVVFSGSRESQKHGGSGFFSLEMNCFHWF